MNARQLAKLNMYRAVQRFTNNELPGETTVPAFTKKLQAFNAKLDEISLLIREELHPTHGITRSKKAARTRLCKKAVNMSGLVYAYAVDTGNIELQFQCHYSYTNLFRTHDCTLADRCRNIYDAAFEHREALRASGVSDAVLAAFMEAITDFKSKQVSTRHAIVNKKVAGDTLKTKMKEADSLLKDQLDNLLVSFENDHPYFVSAYRANRSIIDAPKARTSFVAETEESTVTPGIINTNLPLLTNSNATATVIHIHPPVTLSSAGNIASQLYKKITAVFSDGKTG